MISSEHKEIVPDIADIQEHIERPFEQLHGNDAMSVVRKFYDAQTLDIDEKSFAVNELAPQHETGNPIIFIPGFYAEGDSFRQIMYDMYLAGRRAITYNTYHGVPSDGLYFEDFKQEYATKIQQLQDWDTGAKVEPQLRKAALVIRLAKMKQAELGVKKFDLFGHSEGGIVATICSHLEPELFGKKAILNPAGMIGDVSVKTLKARKGLDDAEVIRQRTGQRILAMRNKTRGAVANIVPGISVSKDRGYTPLRYRRISKRYGEDPRLDLSSEQLKQIKRTWFEWFNTKLAYFKKLKREYYQDADTEQLKEELDALAARRLERWLTNIDTSEFIIGSATHDKLFPTEAVTKYAEEADVPVVKIHGTTHNTQHFHPDKITSFLHTALDIEPPTIQRMEESLGTSFSQHTLQTAL